MHSMKDKVVIITGGSAGIGLAAARNFSASGARVLITGRRQAVLEEAVAGLANAETLVADVSVPADAKRTVDAALGRWGRLDVVVNNAGAGAPIPLVDSSIDRISAIFGVNVLGPTLLAAAAVPALEASRGSIINVSSTLAQRPASNLSAYAASKAALEQLTRCWALELAPRGIRVNAVASGPVESLFLEERMGLSRKAAEAVKEEERRRIPLGRRGEPADVAAWISALAAPSASWMTGQVVGVDGGFVLV